MFAKKTAADELPVGSYIEFGDEIEISQGAEIGRPSTLFARVEGSSEQVERVEVGGSAVIVARGAFRLPA